jgi:GT2 family glycosyltransferase
MSHGVDVVIPTRNTRDVTLRCVRSVLAAGDDAVAVKCILVDNASADGTANAVEERWPEVEVVRNRANVGYAKACNQGARRGAAEFILILNSDVFARAGAIGRLAAFLAEHERHVAASGRLVDAGTERPQTGFAVRGYPSVANQIALLVGLERFWPTNPVSRRQVLPDFDFDRTQDLEAQPSGACLLVRRADYEAVGGFDESFYFWFEDVDLLRRLAKRGAIGYVHDATFEHLGGRTFAQWNRPDVVRARYSGLLRYFEKHHSRPESLALRSVVTVLAGVRVAALWPLDRTRANAYREVVALARRRDLPPAVPTRAEGDRASNASPAVANRAPSP